MDDNTVKTHSSKASKRRYEDTIEFELERMTLSKSSTKLFHSKPTQLGQPSPAACDHSRTYLVDSEDVRLKALYSDMKYINLHPLDFSDSSLQIDDLMENHPAAPVTPPSYSSMQMSLATLDEKTKSLPRRHKDKIKLTISSMCSYDERMDAYESQCGISFPCLDYTHDSNNSSAFSETAYSLEDCEP
jgi:hypothetical protein